MPLPTSKATSSAEISTQSHVSESCASGESNGPLAKSGDSVEIAFRTSQDSQKKVRGMAGL